VSTVYFARHSNMLELLYFWHLSCFTILSIGVFQCHLTP